MENDAEELHNLMGSPAAPSRLSTLQQTLSREFGLQVSDLPKPPALGQ